MFESWHLKRHLVFCLPETMSKMSVGFLSESVCVWY